MEGLKKINICEGADWLLSVTRQNVEDLRKCNETESEIMQDCENCSWHKKIFAPYEGHSIDLCAIEPVIKAVLGK